MIARIVTMTFKENEINNFVLLFNEYKTQIKNSTGCISLTLIQKLDHPTEISTLSYWENEDYLNNYRNSDIFKQVWPQTKLLFSSPPKAISYEILTIT